MKASSPKKLAGNTQLIHSELFPEEMQVVASAFKQYGEEVQFTIKSNDASVYALSQHFIAEFVEGRKKYQLELSQFKHILDIRLLREERGIISILIDENEMGFKAEHGIDFARLLYRNISIAHFAHSAQQKPQIFASQSSIFPPFNPPLSLSQIFQFFYSSFLKYNDLQYNHIPVKYFHYLLSNAIPVFDCSRLPQSTSDYLASALFSMMCFPNIKGFVCHDCLFPLVFRAIAQMLTVSPQNLSIIHVNNCNPDSSYFGELCDAIASQELVSLEYFDISDTMLESPEQLSQLVSTISGPLVHLGLSNCGLGDFGTEQLMDGLVRNKKLSKLKELKIGGASFTNNALLHFSGFLQHLNNGANDGLTFLDISNTGNATTSLLKILLKVQQPLQKLNIAGTDFSRSGFNELKTLISSTPSLINLDMSDSRFASTMLGDIIQLIGARQNCSIKLNGVITDEEMAIDFCRGVLSSPLENFVSISIDKSIITRPTQLLFSTLFSKLNLQEVSVNDLNDDSPEFIADLLRTNIGRINARSSIASNPDIVLSALETTKTHFIDLSSNELKDADIIKTMNTIRSNENLSSVKICGNEIDDANTLDYVVQTAVFLERCTECMFRGCDDFGFDNLLCYDKMAEAIDKHRADRGLFFEFPIEYKINHLISHSLNILQDLNVHQHCVLGPAINLQYPFLDYYGKIPQVMPLKSLYGLPVDQISDGFEGLPSQAVAGEKRGIKNARIAKVCNDAPFVAFSPIPVIEVESSEDNEINQNKNKKSNISSDSDDQVPAISNHTHQKPPPIQFESDDYLPNDNAQIVQKPPPFDSDEEDEVEQAQFQQNKGKHDRKKHTSDTESYFESEDSEDILNTSLIPTFKPEMFGNLGKQLPNQNPQKPYLNPIVSPKRKLPEPMKLSQSSPRKSPQDLKKQNDFWSHDPIIASDIPEQHEELDFGESTNDTLEEINPIKANPQLIRKFGPIEDEISSSALPIEIPPPKPYLKPKAKPQTPPNFYLFQPPPEVPKNSPEMKPSPIKKQTILSPMKNNKFRVKPNEFMQISKQDNSSSDEIPLPPPKKQKNQTSSKNSKIPQRAINANSISPQNPRLTPDKQDVQNIKQQPYMTPMNRERNYISPLEIALHPPLLSETDSEY